MHRIYYKIKILKVEFFFLLTQLDIQNQSIYTKQNGVNRLFYTFTKTKKNSIKIYLTWTLKIKQCSHDKIKPSVGDQLLDIGMPSGGGGLIGIGGIAI